MSNTERIARMVENDSSGAVRRTLGVVQSDVAFVLSQFMDVSRLDMSVAKKNEGYKVTIEIDVDRFYSVGNTSVRE